MQQARQSVRNLPPDLSILSGIAYFSDNPAIMKKITLQFTSLDDLWDFVLDSKLEFIEINIRKKLLVCQCSEKDVELALTLPGSVTKLWNYEFFVTTDKQHGVL